MGGEVWMLWNIVWHSFGWLRLFGRGGVFSHRGEHV